MGYAMLGPADLPIETSVRAKELKRIYLLHRFHGGGVDRRLMQAALDAAIATGSRRMLLGVYEANHNALAF